ncbi:MAG: hypothetical protein CMK64_04980 [Pseudoalteromonas sp.]|nr:hypothetical protein [Pseudoalteromonas sp.]|tara:strand:+ start:7538 stop:7864 length:327 start_codon:yes stop_codon:yes gene_type:complete
MITPISASLISLVGMWNVADCTTMEMKEPAGTAFIIKENREHYSMNLLFVNNRFSRLKSKKDEVNKFNFANQKFKIELEGKGKGLTFSSWQADGQALVTDNLCFVKKS